jgi:acetolactate synthase-1/2/3 large subunit
VPCSLLLGEMPVTTPPTAPYAVPPTEAPDMSEIAAALAGARYPIIISEYVGRSVTGVNALVEIAETLGAAVYDGVDPLYVNFPWDHPLYQGIRPEAVLAASDVILCAGVTTPWFPPADHVPPKTRVIMIDDDIDKTRLPYWNYRIQTRVPGDIDRNLAALAAALRQTVGAADPRREARVARRLTLAAAHREMAGGWQKEAATALAESKLSTADFLERLRILLPPETLIVDEAITHSGLIRRILGRSDNYIKVGSGGLGVGLGYAIGVKLTLPQRPVVFLVGDGTFTYNPVLAGLAACREYDLPLLIVVLDNGGYAAIRGAYRRYRPDGWAVGHGEFPGADFKPEPDYAALAAGFDAVGYRVSLPGETAAAVTAALAQMAAGRSSIIDVKLDS